MNVPAVVELRQYALKPGRRDELVDLFERCFLEPQERLGAHVLGHFRDLDDADRFVWLRGYADHASRLTALESFYAGEVWRAHSEAANATMLDSDNVLLLRPAGSRPSFVAAPLAPGRGLYAATVWSFASELGEDAAGELADTATSVLTSAAATVVATLVTDSTPNGYPRLPVREGEHVLVWLVRFADRAALDAYAELTTRAPGWPALERQLAARGGRRSQTLRLAPAARSRLA